MKTISKISMCAAALVLASCGADGGEGLLVITGATPPVGDITVVPIVCAYEIGIGEDAFPVFDTSAGSGPFALGINVENRMANAGAIGLNDVTLIELHIKYESTGGAAISVAEQVTPLSGFVSAGGKGIYGGVLIPEAVKASLAAVSSVRLLIQAWGKTTDGNAVKSAVYRFAAAPIATSPDSSACRAK